MTVDRLHVNARVTGRGSVGAMHRLTSTATRLLGSLPGVTVSVAARRIVCDTCGATSEPLPADPQEARDLLTSQGWALADDADTCPRHQS